MRSRNSNTERGTKMKMTAWFLAWTMQAEDSGTISLSARKKQNKPARLGSYAWWKNKAKQNKTFECEGKIKMLLEKEKLRRHCWLTCPSRKVSGNSLGRYLMPDDTWILTKSPDNIFFFKKRLHMKAITLFLKKIHLKGNCMCRAKKWWGYTPTFVYITPKIQ